jgi:hypothetical protein
MISPTDAVNVLIRVSQGTYKNTVYSTTCRQFTQAYKSIDMSFKLDPELHNKVFSAYVPHEWINK